MSVDYIRWIEDALRRNPHLNQAGLARHLGRNRSIVTSLLKGERSIKVDEIDRIASYLGEPPPSRVGVTSIDVVGVVGTGWYEEDEMPSSGRRVAPDLEHPEKQVAFEVRDSLLGIPAGAILIAVPVSREPLDNGTLAVVRREKSGMVRITLGRVGEIDDGEPVARVIEVRTRP